METTSLGVKDSYCRANDVDDDDENNNISTEVNNYIQSGMLSILKVE